MSDRAEHPGRRATDHGWRRIVRENAYRDIWLLVITIVLLLIAIKAFDSSAKTHDALCTFRRDLQERVDSGNAFLSAHPHGIPGIPVAVIRTSVTGQQRTIAALNGLGCRTPKVNGPRP
jgi:hypothetical protein